MTHLGQRLSALVDGELDSSERERAVWHMAKCRSCQEEVAALWALKRKLNGLRESASTAGHAGLTRRLMGLSELLDFDDATLSGGMTSGESIWPPPPPPGGWPAQGRPQEDAAPANRDSHPDQRGGRLFLAGSVAIFLAGLGTAAVIAGGEPQARAPAPPVTPSVDVLVAPHNGYVNQGPTRSVPGSGVLVPGSRGQWSRPGVDSTYLPDQP
jgi:Putative zinc-finger